MDRKEVQVRAEAAALQPLSLEPGPGLAGPALSPCGPAMADGERESLDLETDAGEDDLFRL